MFKKMLVIFAACVSFSAIADTDFINRPDVKRFINDVSKQYDISKKSLQETLSKVKLQKRVIRSIKNPKEKKAWTDYRKIFVTPSRIMQGKAFWQKNKALLEKAEKQYGVPQEIIVAIIGVETHFGTKQGSYRVIDSLSTLAFNFKKRSRFFKKELAQFLVLCKEQGITPTSVYGSYAGAIGQSQFMPSSYREYAVDFSGDGKVDLRNSTADAIGSVANYLSCHGWKNNQGVVEQAIISGKRYKRVVTSARYAKHSIKKLNHYGVKGKNNKSAAKGSLLALHSPNKTEYWLAYPNFFVITKYNTSKQYALAVYLLAEEIKKS